MYNGNGSGLGNDRMPTPDIGPNPWGDLPFRGSQMDVRRDDPPHLQPQVKFEAHTKIFDMSQEDQMKEYEAIIQQCADGEAVIGLEDVQYCEDTKSWRIFLRWYDQFYEAPKLKVGDQQSDPKTQWGSGSK